jgi:hypothetical protein
MNTLQRMLRSRESAVVIVILTVLLISEIGIRKSLSRLSIDHAHLEGIPSMVDEMATDQKTKVLIMGNSLARKGINEGQLLSAADVDPADLHMYRFIPDGGSIGNWTFGWERYFWKPESHPELILLCGGAAHYRDGKLDPLATGSTYVSSRNLVQVMYNDFNEAEDRLRLAGAFFSHGYANAYRVRRRALDIFTPRYRSAAQSINEQRKRTTQEKFPPTTAPEATLDRLTNFVSARLRERIRVIVINMPSFDGYEPPANIRSSVGQAGGSYLDMRHVDGLDDTCFVDPYGADPYHLNAHGAEVFTHALALELKDEFAKLLNEP